MIILVHGWCGDSTIWRNQIGCLEAVGETIALDLPGHGTEGQPLDPDVLSIATCAAHVVRAVERAASSPVVLVGHSMGGPVALEAAIALGERCALLVGVDTFTDPRFYARRPADEIAERLSRFAYDFEGEIVRMIGRIVAPHVSAALVVEIAASMARTHKANALAALDSLLAYDIEARWGLLRAAGRTINSRLLADPAADLILPGLVVHSMPDVGHFPMLEAPDAFNAQLVSILGQACPGVSSPSSTTDRR